MSTSIPSGLDDEHKARLSDDTLPAPPKDILDQFLDLKIEQYYNDNEDDEVLVVHIHGRLCRMDYTTLSSRI